MNILYISTSFPNEAQGSTIYTDLAEELFSRGHNIYVIVSEQKKNQRKSSFFIERGFPVLRIITGNYYDVSFFVKGVSMLLTPLFLKLNVNKFISLKHIDFILFESPPLTVSSFVLWLKKKYQCPAYLMLKDIFPQNAVDIGIIKANSFLHKYFSKKERLLYKTSNFIGCMSNANVNYMQDNYNNIIKGHIELFPNTKKIAIDYSNINQNLRLKYGLPKDSCIFLLGGNMGKPQFIDLICNVINKTKNHPELFFLFIGRGTDRVKIEKTIKSNSITNAMLLNSLPRDEFEEITKLCDVGLITLDPRFTVPNYPSRVLTYLEFAKPIIAATDKVTDIKDLIEIAQCGTWVYSGDQESFLKEIFKMANNTSRIKLGINGRKYIEKHLKIESSAKILESHFC